MEEKVTSLTILKILFNFNAKMHAVIYFNILLTTQSIIHQPSELKTDHFFKYFLVMFCRFEDSKFVFTVKRKCQTLNINKNFDNFIK
jgi:hypothetical protein